MKKILVVVIFSFFLMGCVLPAGLKDNYKKTVEVYDASQKYVKYIKENKEKLIKLHQEGKIDADFMTNLDRVLILYEDFGNTLKAMGLLLEAVDRSEPCQPPTSSSDSLTNKESETKSESLESSGQK